MGERKLYTVRELREAIGKDKIGRDTAYMLARKFGVRLGNRLLVPQRVVEALLDGRLEELELELALKSSKGRAPLELPRR
ncbi:hypothetical protein [Thermus tengchongensis]|uniref:DNA-binding protein n=1 Tax=Thermus tengchongensis TaxID=1214928 RepID=A0A4Y9F7D5_9DEIN|nr:hypothetical protein [Thermus tengchongensis]TFU25056.1 hypothetical protein E0687_12725 [Thermus tengchongensis]